MDKCINAYINYTLIRLFKRQEEEEGGGGGGEGGGEVGNKIIYWQAVLLYQ